VFTAGNAKSAERIEGGRLRPGHRLVPLRSPRALR